VRIPTSRKIEMENWTTTRNGPNTARRRGSAGHYRMVRERAHLIGLQEISIIRGNLPELGAFEMNFGQDLGGSLPGIHLAFRPQWCVGAD